MSEDNSDKPINNMLVGKADRTLDAIRISINGKLQPDLRAFVDHMVRVFARHGVPTAGIERAVDAAILEKYRRDAALNRFPADVNKCDIDALRIRQMRGEACGFATDETAYKPNASDSVDGDAPFWISSRVERKERE